MLAQIAYLDKDYDPLICEGKTLRGSAAQPDCTDDAKRFITLVMLYALQLRVVMRKPILKTTVLTSALSSKPCCAHLNWKVY
jgi:hypothetical protein